MSSIICFSLDQSKILSSGNGLKIQVAHLTKDNLLLNLYLVLYTIILSVW